MSEINKGHCYLCGKEFSKVGYKKHILGEHSYAGDDYQDCALLKVEDNFKKVYWLYLDIPMNSTLKTLDTFLRNIWLECCGHMSSFAEKDWWEIGMGKKISSFPIGTKLYHQYDFGSTTELIVSFVGTTRRPKQHKAVRLLSRNKEYSFDCAYCGLEAELVCCELIDGDGNPFVCEACAVKHELDCLLPIVNSPRMGVCGYCGDLDVYGFDPEMIK